MKAQDAEDFINSMTEAQKAVFHIMGIPYHVFKEFENKANEELPPIAFDKYWNPWKGQWKSKRPERPKLNPKFISIEVTDYTTLSYAGELKRLQVAINRLVARMRQDIEVMKESSDFRSMFITTFRKRQPDPNVVTEKPIDLISCVTISHTNKA